MNICYHLKQTLVTTIKHDVATMKQVSSGAILVITKHYLSWNQCCGAKTFCFRSGSGSSSGSGSDISFVSTFYHRFHFKKWIFHVFLWKNTNLIHMLDSIQYEFWFLLTTQTDPEPEPKLRHSGSGSSQKFRLLSAPAPAPQHCMKQYRWTLGLVSSLPWDTI